MTQPVSPEDALSDGSITQAEMLLLFGATMPPEAVHLIYDPANDGKTLREIRRKLRQLAASRTDPPKTALDEEVERLREALKPFADAADDLLVAHRDNGEIWETSAAMSITAGDLRRARAALAYHTTMDRFERRARLRLHGLGP